MTTRARQALPTFHLAWFRGIAPRFLPIWFAVFSLREALIPVASGALGDDAKIYYRAAEHFVAGTSIWDASASHAGRTYHFFAAPSVAVLFAPFTLIPEQLFVPLFVGVQAASGIYLVRRLQLPWWWLLFPPLVTGVAWGNPSVMVVALLVVPNAVANAFAPLVKAYAGLPLIGEWRWRALLIMAAFGLLTVAAAPAAWFEFFAGSGSRTQELLREANGGFDAVWNVGVFTFGILAILVIALHDRRMAGWLAPIAFWPGSQFHWSTLALPVMNPWLAITLAVPSQAMPVLAVVGIAWWMLWRRLWRPRAED